MGANVAALVIVVLAVYLLIVGLRGTQADVWKGLFSNAKSPGGVTTTSDTGTTGSNGTGGGGGQPLTFSQLRGLAQQAGFSQADSIIAAAVALAESRGNPSTTGPYGERGLWQINITAHPDVAAKYNLWDPAQNAQAAFAVFTDRAAWDTSGWNAWTTYINGAYKAFLPTL